MTGCSEQCEETIDAIHCDLARCAHVGARGQWHGTTRAIVTAPAWTFLVVNRANVGARGHQLLR